MVNLILNAVTKQLGTTFGKSYHYYVENVEQGLVKPCFTADVLIPLQRSKSPLLYDRTMPIVVHYFSDSKTNTKNDCYSVAERVVECLEYLPFKDGLIRGEDISWQMTDDVLQVFVTYKFTTIKDSETETMLATLETNFSHSNSITFHQVNSIIINDTDLPSSAALFYVRANT